MSYPAHNIVPGHAGARAPFARQPIADPAAVAADAEAPDNRRAIVYAALAGFLGLAVAAILKAGKLTSLIFGAGAFVLTFEHLGDF